MDEEYLTKENISSKADEWLSQLPITHSREERFKFKAENSALLVIDMQEFFLKEESHAYVPSAKAIITNINALIEAYRRWGLPPIFTRHAVKDDENEGMMGRFWGEVLRDSNPLSMIDSSIDIREEDNTIRKTRYSAFFHTRLEETLRSLGVEAVTIAGVMTHLCCESTARDAFMRNLEVVVITDATATVSEQFHVSSLRALGHGFAVLLRTKEALTAIGSRTVCG